MPFPRARAARLWLTASALGPLPAATASAEEPFELIWQAPPECPQRAAVRERIDDLVPQAVLERGHLRAEGTITRAETRFRLRLVMHLGDVTGERSIESESCGDLAGAAAVALGLLLEAAGPRNGSGAPASTPADASATESSAAGVTTPAAEGPNRARSTPTPVARRDDSAVPDGGSRERSWRAFLAPQAGLDVGPLARPATGVAFSAGVLFQRWQVMAGARLPVEQRVELAHGLGAALRHFSLSLGVCRALSAPPFEVTPCAAFGLEHLSATATGPVESAQRANANWISVGADAWGRWYVTDWLALSVGVGGRVQAARPSVKIEGIPATERLRPVALLLRAGPMLVF